MSLSSEDALILTRSVPLTPAEISQSAKLVREASQAGGVKFNSITLLEPAKADNLAYQDSKVRHLPRRSVAVVISRSDYQVSGVTLNLESCKVDRWRDLDQITPILTLEDLDVVERIARTNSQVIRACKELGITDTSEVFLDDWAIGVKKRWGFARRLQQALPYYRSSSTDNQYAHPLDFVVIADMEREEILSVDIRTVNGERTAFPTESHNYLPEHIGHQYNHNLLKPINTTQPESVSFKVDGNEII